MVARCWGYTMIDPLKIRSPREEAEHVVAMLLSYDGRNARRYLRYVAKRDRRFPGAPFCAHVLQIIRDRSGGDE